MFNWIKENSIAFAIAVICHILIMLLLFINWQTEKADKIVFQQGNIVQVTAVDAASYAAQVQKIEQKKAAEKQRAEERQRKKIAEEKKRKAALKKAEMEKKRKQAERKKRLAEEKRKQEKLNEELQKKQLQKKEKLKKEKLETERRKKAEQEKRRRAEQKKIQEAEKKRKAEEKRKAEARRKAEAERQAEQERTARERRSKGIINRYVALIVQKIEQNWRQPLNTESGLQCKIDIVLLPDGRVVSVDIVESSGRQDFDRSVENAVRKASPLPVPTDKLIFKEFETMRLRFNPGNY